MEAKTNLVDNRHNLVDLNTTVHLLKHVARAAHDAAYDSLGVEDPVRRNTEEQVRQLRLFGSHKGARQ